jgi:hypothetical protein
MKDSHPLDRIDIKSKFFIFTATFAFIAFLTQFLLSGFFGIIWALIDTAFISIVITLILRFFRAKYYTFRIQFLRTFLLFSAITWVFSLILWIGVFLSNTYPWALSKITLSNWEKTIVYYQMSHIATKRYYDTIQTELKGYAGSGYVLYLEWVLPGTPENQAKLEQALGMKISSGTYEEIATLMGMSSQDDSLYNGIDTWSLVHADLSVDDIVAHISTGSLRSENPVDISSELDLAGNGEKNRSAVTYVFRWILNASLRYSLTSDGMLDVLGPETMAALLDKRNQKVVDTYLDKNTKNSIFLYGALHFDGIYAILKSKDPRWEVRSYDPLYPYVH